jgi:arabinogalactan oligomer/maltooligosaccharide transport system permease protein
MSAPGGISHARRFAAGLAVAAVVVGALGAWVLSSARTHEANLRAERLAVVPLRAVTQAVAAAGADGEAARAAVASVQEKLRDRVTSIRVVEGRELLASTASADTGENAAPRSLAREEKPLYDRADLLRKAVQSNADENSAREQEISVLALADGGRSVAAPLMRDGEVVGMVQVETKAESYPRGSAPLAAFALLFLPCVVLVFFPNRRALAAAVAIVALSVATAGLGLALRSTLASDRASTDQAVSALAGSLGGGSLDVDRYQQPFDSKATLADDAAFMQKLVWGLALLGAGITAFFGFGAAARVGAIVKRHREAYAYVTPAMIGMLILVFFPFIYGITLSFTDSNLYNTDKTILDTWVGLKNYGEVLGDFQVFKSTDAGWVPNYQNFYWTFFFTVIWTVTNVAIGVSVGLVLALILNTKGLAGRPIYRVLLIFPWAMPNYITALIWKGMFHQQFGVVNQMLQLVGIEPVSWFEKPWTSYFTALATNGWLSFPFMMVVALGALQSIPADLYEAARVDGATKWQQFRSITLPSLKPALVPAIILSVVWTFNMFNIIYLVTAGEPGGSTEILITQSYKIAFEKYQYGYAAAYSTVIFAILLVYGWFQNRISKASEGV